MSMTEREKADCLLALQESQMNHLLQTRDIEFKVNIAIWTLIALAGYFLSGRVRLASVQDIMLYTVAAALIYFSHLVLWMLPIQNSADQDSHYIREYRLAVESLVGCSITPFELHYIWQAKLRQRGWLWVLGETGLTLILLIAVGLVLGMGPQPL